MTNILVLGIGNPLLGDDGLGPEVVRQLESVQSLPQVELMDGGSTGLYLLAHLQGRSHVLVVDAVDFGGQPGQITRMPGPEIPAYVGMKLSEHQVTFHDVLAMLQLMDAPKELLLLGVQPKSSQWGDSLSPEVEAAIPQLVQQVVAQLHSWTNQTAAKPTE